MQALILAAGNSRRLRPLTDSISKVMVEVCGETIIKRALNNLYPKQIDVKILFRDYPKISVQST